PRVRFLFVGDGILRDELRALARDVGVEDKVVFAGLVDPACIPEMIHAMDVVVHASLREGLARVLPQAFLCGKPVISYDVDGAKEVVLDGKTGYLVPPQSVDELAEAIVKTLSNPVRAREMAEAGRALVIERFDADTMVAQIDALYKRLLARRWSVVDG
ncbi:MAG: glycosyltransferase family 4 protein, partial [Planctomycetes bacterium]|nr:glycosyltransferase family 4 protein [Planctomycetota bacterium]